MRAQIRFREGLRQILAILRIHKLQVEVHIEQVLKYQPPRR